MPDARRVAISGSVLCLRLVVAFCACVTEELFELMDNLTKESGDVLWMIAGLHSVLNKRLETTAHLNIHKLTSRKNRGVIVGEGDNR